MTLKKMDKRIMILDTETSGIVNKKNALDKQPYILEFAAVTMEMRDKMFKIVERQNKRYKPPISIPRHSTRIHGIRDEDVEGKRAISQDIAYIRASLENADILVGHNVNFDLNMIWVELKRAGLADGFLEAVQGKVIDTMSASKEHVQAKNKRGHLKNPKLAEVHQKLFGYVFENAHSAIGDVMATAKVFVELHKRGLISLEKSGLDT